MATSTQTVNVNLRPLNQQAPTTKGPVGRVDSINNGVVHKFLNGGDGPQLRIDKRPAFNTLGSDLIGDSGSLPGFPRWLADFRGQLVGVFNTTPEVYSEAENKWVGRQTSQAFPTIAYQTLSKRPIFNLNTALNTPDGAAVGDRIMSTFRSGVAGTETSYLGVADAGGVVLSPPRTSLITGNFRVKCVSDGAVFWVASQATAMTSTVVQCFDETGAQLATTTFAWGAARDNWDLRFAPALGQVVLATPLGGTTDLRFMTYAATVITVVTHATPAADCTKGCAWLDNSAGSNVYLGGCDNTFGVRAFEIDATGAILHTFAVDTGNTDYVGNLTGFAEYGNATPGSVTVAYSVLRDNTGGSSVALNNQTRVIVAARVGGTVTSTLRSLGVASRAYHDTEGNYFAVMYYQGTAFRDTAGGFDVTQLNAQPSYFVAALSPPTPSVVGQFDYGFAAFQSQSRVSVDFNPWHISSVSTDLSGDMHVPLGYLGEQNSAGGVLTSFTGINDYVMSPRAGRPTATTDELLIPGMQAMRFDGNVFVEDGFQLAPDFPDTLLSGDPNPLPSGPGGNMNTAETYNICAVYEWLDNAGNVIQSIPSRVIADIALGAGNKTLTSAWSTLRTSTKTNVRISYYRTFSPTPGGNTPGVELRKVGEVMNNPGVDQVEFTDTFSDAVVSSGQEMYTQPLILSAPQPLEYFPAPPHSRSITFDGRTFVIGYDNAIWFSEQRAEGFGAPFNPELRIIMPTTATVLALVPMDARLLILCADGTAWTVPSGGLPNATLTTGSIPQPEQLPFTVGSEGAALMLPIGAIFGAKAGAWMMDRGLSAQFVGAGVQDELSGTAQILDICVDDAQRVYFTLGQDGLGGTLSRMLVYDLVVGCWYTWDAPTEPVVACSWKGRYVFADTAVPANVWLLDKDDATSFTDDGAAIITTVALSSLSFAGPNGYMLLWGGEFFGQYKGSHLIKTSFTFDNADVPAQVFTQPVGTDPDIYRWDVRQDRTKMAAVAVTFEDSFDWPTIASIASHAGNVLKVGDTSMFREGATYCTFVGTVIDPGSFTVTSINAPQGRITVQPVDGWTAVDGRPVTFVTDSLLPGNSFQLEAISLRIGNKVGLDKLPTSRRIGYGVTP